MRKAAAFQNLRHIDSESNCCTQQYRFDGFTRNKALITCKQHEILRGEHRICSDNIDLILYQSSILLRANTQRFVSVIIVFADTESLFAKGGFSM